MCGIVAGFSKKGKRISKSIMKRYLDQKHRGSQGFGYVAFYKDGKGGKISVGRSTDEPEIRTQIMNEHSSMIMFHHRFPTSTPNVVEATHPIYVSHDELDFDYFVVHNGVVRNATELRTKHENLKYVYSTIIESEVVTHHTSKKTGAKYFTGGTKTEKFNDSEALAIEVARVLDGMTSVIDAVGTVAIVAWKINKETGKLVSISYGHNSGNPLTISDTSDSFFLTSMGGTDLPEDILYTLSTDGDSLGTTTQREMPIGFITEYARVKGSNNYVFSHTQNYTPRLPAPVDGINKKLESLPYIREGKRYASYNEYYEEKFGMNNSVRDNDDKYATKLDKFMKESKVGFTTEGNESEARRSTASELSEDEYRIDTSLDTTGEFFMKTSSEMVKQYLELEDMMDDVEADIDTAEFLLSKSGKEDEKSISILKEDIKQSEEKVESIQEKMNEVEDRYTELFPSRSSFRTLLDAYMEQSEDDGILYDIQMEDEKRQYELSKHF